LLAAGVSTTTAVRALRGATAGHYEFPTDWEKKKKKKKKSAWRRHRWLPTTRPAGSNVTVVTGPEPQATTWRDLMIARRAIVSPRLLLERARSVIKR
jgi:hypothetical protein